MNTGPWALVDAFTLSKRMIRIKLKLCLKYHELGATDWYFQWCFARSNLSKIGCLFYFKNRYIIPNCIESLSTPLVPASIRGGSYRVESNVSYCNTIPTSDIPAKSFYYHRGGFPQRVTTSRPEGRTAQYRKKLQFCFRVLQVVGLWVIWIDMSTNVL